MFMLCCGSEANNVQLDLESHVTAKSDTLIELSLFKKWVASSFCPAAANIDTVMFGKNDGANAPAEAKNCRDYFYIRAIDIRNS